MIFDEIAEKYGLNIRPSPTPRHALDSPTQQIPVVPPRQQPQPPAPSQYPVVPHMQPCAVCATRDRPAVLLHQHLDEVNSSLHARIAHLERVIMAAIDNANAQLENLKQTISGTVVPGIQQLATAAANPAAGGVSEEAVQALADGISTATSEVAQALQSALAQIPAPPAA